MSLQGGNGASTVASRHRSPRQAPFGTSESATKMVRIILTLIAIMAFLLAGGSIPFASTLVSKSSGSGTDVHS
ncbi:unnamed protein product [Urochloa humidicola]